MSHMHVIQNCVIYFVSNNVLMYGMRLIISYRFDINMWDKPKWSKGEKMQIVIVGGGGGLKGPAIIIRISKF